jgi:hypothetical protein
MSSAMHRTAFTRKRFEMTAIARVLSRATGVEIDVDSLRPILIVCGAGLMLSLLMMMSGCDLGTSSEWIPPA